MAKKKKIKHNYTSELELKSLLIRIKNFKEGKIDKTANSKINKYIKWYTAINNKKYNSPTKRNIVKNNIKERIVQLSEKTSVDDISYERFGAIILLMIKNILKQPCFSGYTFQDEFYSDAAYKILKYLHNFNHKMISKRTGQPVNAFAYISQYIHNSILYIIKTKNNEEEKIRKHIRSERLANNIEIKNFDWIQNNSYNPEEDVFYDKEADEKIKISEEISIMSIDTSLVQEIKNMQDEIDEILSINHVQRVEIIYPKDYIITLDEYNELKPLLKGKISITRAREPENANAKS